MNSQPIRWLRGASMVLSVALAACGSDMNGQTGAIGGAGTGTAARPAIAAGSGAPPVGVTGGQTAPPSAGRTGAPTGTAGSTVPTGARSGAGGTGVAGTAAGAAATGVTAGMSAGAVAGMAAVAGSSAGAAGASMGAAGSGTPAMATSGCTPAPMGGDLKKGPFDAMVVSNTGPSGQYTIFRPTMLGMNGFKHPPVSWGNGVTTTPDLYTAWLTRTATHGFVVIASNSSSITAAQVRQGLEWLIMQNASGDYAGKLAVDCAATIGYSMGGGAAVGAGSHPAVKAVVSVHGLPDASGSVSGPLLLTTSDDDSFVTKDGFVQPCYNSSSKQPTIMATYISGNAGSFAGHLTPLGDGAQDSDPTIAWLRYWLYGDQDQKSWFFGADCKLCVKPWGMVQKKNYMWD